MRVAIMTFHCSYNFGSALQAYALQRAIEMLGHECNIIDYRSRDFESYKLIKLRKPAGMLHSIVNYRKNSARKAAFEKFWEEHLHLTEQTFTYRNERDLESLQGEFDCFVCGSDQIWNLDCTKGVVGPFFLSFAGNRRRVAYAPSLGHTSFEKAHFDKKLVSQHLAQFDYISVREAETIPVFQPLISKRIVHAIDPTLLLEGDAYKGIANPATQDSPYVFAYMLSENTALVESIKQAAVEQGRVVLYVASRDLRIPNTTNMLGIGPSEFISLLANAETVLTNSFHATVFSILFRKTFNAFDSGRSSSRILGLLEELSLRNRFAESPVESPSAISDDWRGVDTRLNSLRAGSWEYLRGALS